LNKKTSKIFKKISCLLTVFKTQSLSNLLKTLVLKEYGSGKMFKLLFFLFSMDILVVLVKKYALNQRK
jgi:hypothetical protein